MIYNREAFKEYLELLDPESTFCTDERCPLEQWNNKDKKVDNYQDVIVKLTDKWNGWADKFVEQIDDLPKSWINLTAKETLKTLNAI